MNKIRYTDLHIRFLGTQSSTGSYQHGSETPRQATKSALTGIKKQTKEKSYEKYIRSNIML